MEAARAGPTETIIDFSEYESTVMPTPSGRPNSLDGRRASLSSLPPYTNSTESGFSSRSNSLDGRISPPPPYANATESASSSGSNSLDERRSLSSQRIQPEYFSDPISPVDVSAQTASAANPMMEQLKRVLFWEKVKPCICNPLTLAALCVLCFPTGAWLLKKSNDKGELSVPGALLMALAIGSLVRGVTQ